MKVKTDEVAITSILKLKELPTEIKVKRNPLAIYITYFDGVGGNLVRYIPSKPGIYVKEKKR